MPVALVNLRTVDGGLFRDACVRTLGDYDSPLFCFRDVCFALGIGRNNHTRKSQKSVVVCTAGESSMQSCAD